MDQTNDAINKIFDQLAQKGSLKQNIFRNTIEHFECLKLAAQEVVKELKSHEEDYDKDIEISFTERSKTNFELKFAGDVLVFHMHTNVFNFDRSHAIWKSNYVKEDANRAYCGMINVYNFLADSFKYNRENDIGYLVARIFVNLENHFFVEGKRQLGFLYNNFSTETLDSDKCKAVIESAMLYAMDFDLLTPPYDAMKQVTVYQILASAQSSKVSTGKRLGFRFQADSDIG